MPKNLFQDMVKIKRKDMGKYIQQDEGEEEGIKKPNKKGPKSLWLVAMLSIVFFLFALSYLFAKAEVTVNPKVKDFVLDESFSATKDSSNANGLSFDLVVISGEEQQEVVATEEKDLSVKSTGTVLIYNTFSSSPQKLSIDTRLEGSNGKIYKTTTAIIVPGQNSNGTPGSVEVAIYGAEAGSAYNSIPLDFKIFGFKGTPKYSKFYARSKGEITGGLIGKFPVVLDTDKISVASTMRAILHTKLLKKATDQIPSGFVLFKDAAFLNIDAENIDFTPQGNKPVLKIKGTLYGILFNEEDLIKKIAKDNIEKYDENDVYIPNIRELTFSLPAQAGLVNKETSLSNVQNINFTLSGATKIVSKFDGTKLATDLLGKSKKDFNQILSQYPNIDSADLVLSPFWIRSLPSKMKDIKVIVNYPK